MFIMSTIDQNKQGRSNNEADQGALNTNWANNPSLNREVHSATKLVGYCSLMLITEVCKQITSYGMKYYNGGTYPLPQTQIVALAELFKFLVFLLLAVVNESGVRHMEISLWYAIPSVIYVINNNIFYLALHYTTPPVWNILIQLRVILTALTYRLFFHRTITVIQWLSLILLIAAIALSNWIGTTGRGEFQLQSTIALLLAAFGSITSVVGTLVMEFLFKNDSRSFIEKQSQLYMFSSICSWCAYFFQTALAGEHLSNSSASPQVSAIVWMLFTFDLVLACLGGFMVAVVVKKFDNIVKLYTQALANMFTALACWFLFADFFHFTLMFGVCLIIVFVSIVAYELKYYNDIVNVFCSCLSSIFAIRIYLVVSILLLMFLTLSVVVMKYEIFNLTFKKLFQFHD